MGVTSHLLTGMILHGVREDQIMLLSFLSVLIHGKGVISKHQTLQEGFSGASFSRMRSEGFPFIVGVWGWTCVRFVLLPRRRVVVASSSPTR